MGRGVKAIVLGASAGAVQALLQLLPALPVDYAVPVLIVVHVPPGRPNSLVSLFQAKCRIAIKEAEDKEPIQAGVVYFAPSDYHLLVEMDGSLALSSDAVVNHSRPSIDVLFETAADAFGPLVASIILTGANHDGAKGLMAVLERGGIGVVEDPADAYAGMMPSQALRLSPSAEVLSLKGISEFMLGLNAA